MKIQLCQYGFMVVFNSKKQLHVSANSGHLRVITISPKECHIYMSILRGDVEISSSLRVTISLFGGKCNGQ